MARWAPSTWSQATAQRFGLKWSTHRYHGFSHHLSLSCHEHKHRPLPTYDDVVAAAQRLRGVAHRTPVLTSRTMDEQLGARLFFKCENLQRIGAFKFRGAYNALAQFTPEQRKGGALAFLQATMPRPLPRQRSCWTCLP